MNAHFLVTWVEKLQIYAAGVRMQAGVSLWPFFNLPNPFLVPHPFFFPPRKELALKIYCLSSFPPYICSPINIYLLFGLKNSKIICTKFTFFVLSENTVKMETATWSCGATADWTVTLVSAGRVLPTLCPPCGLGRLCVLSSSVPSFLYLPIPSLPFLPTFSPALANHLPAFLPLSIF